MDIRVTEEDTASRKKSGTGVKYGRRRPSRIEEVSASRSEPHPLVHSNDKK